MSYPAPILNLDFANAKQLVHPAVAFSRASIGSYFGSNGLLRYAAAGMPRFEHDPLTGICKGLLVEPAVTFLDTYSEQFDDAAWVKGRATVAPNAITAPDGTMTADKLVEDTSTDTHFFSRTVSVTPLTTYTLSLWVREAGRTTIKFVIKNPADWIFITTATIDVASGVLVGGTGSVKNFEGGWCLCSVPVTVPANCTSLYIQSFISGDTAYTGDGTSGIYIWGAKIYAGTGPTSYLPTVASGVTRAADVCSVDLTKLTRNGSPLWTGTEGTIVVQAITPAWKSLGSSVQVLAQIDDGTASNRVRVYRNSTGNIKCSVDAGGVNQADIDLGVVADSTESKVALSFGANAFYASINGGTSASDTAGTMPTGIVTRRIGCDSVGAQQWGGHIKLDQTYNRPIASGYLQALSAL